MNASDKYDRIANLMRKRDGPSGEFASAYNFTSGDAEPPASAQSRNTLYLHTLVDPFSYPFPRPDTNTRPRVTVTQTWDTSLELENPDVAKNQNSGMVLIFPRRISDSIWHVDPVDRNDIMDETSSIVTVLVPKATIESERDLGAAYEQYRPEAMRVMIKSSTIPAGAFALSGTCTAAPIASINNVRKFTASGILAASMTDKDKVTLTSIGKGTVVTAGPDISGPMRSDPRSAVRSPVETVFVRAEHLLVDVINYADEHHHPYAYKGCNIYDGTLPRHLYNPTIRMRARMYHPTSTGTAFLGSVSCQMMLESRVMPPGLTLLEGKKNSGLYLTEGPNKEYSTVANLKGTGPIAEDTFFGDLRSCTIIMIDRVLGEPDSDNPYFTFLSEPLDVPSSGFPNFPFTVTHLIPQMFTPTTDHHHFTSTVEGWITHGYSQYDTSPVYITAYEGIPNGQNISIAGQGLYVAVPSEATAADVKLKMEQMPPRSLKELAVAEGAFNDPASPFKRTQAGVLDGEVSFDEKHFAAAANFSPIGSALGNIAGALGGALLPGPLGAIAGVAGPLLGSLFSPPKRKRKFAPPPDHIDGAFGAPGRQGGQRSKTFGGFLPLARGNERRPKRLHDPPKAICHRSVFLRADLETGSRVWTGTVTSTDRGALTSALVDLSRQSGSWKPWPQHEEPSFIIGESSPSGTSTSTWARRALSRNFTQADFEAEIQRAIAQDPDSHTHWPRPDNESSDEEAQSKVPKRSFAPGELGPGVTLQMGQAKVGGITTPECISQAAFLTKCNPSTSQVAQELMSGTSKSSYGIALAPSAPADPEQASEGSLHRIFCGPEPVKTWDWETSTFVDTTYVQVTIPIFNLDKSENEATIFISSELGNDDQVLTQLLTVMGMTRRDGVYISMGDRVEAGGWSIGLAMLIAALGFTPKDVAFTGGLEWKGDDQPVKILPIGDGFIKATACSNLNLKLIMASNAFVESLLKKAGAKSAVITIPEILAGDVDLYAPVIRADSISEVLLMLLTGSAASSTARKPEKRALTEAEERLKVEGMAINKKKSGERNEILDALTANPTLAGTMTFDVAIQGQIESVRLLDMSFWESLEGAWRNPNPNKVPGFTMADIERAVANVSIDKLRGYAVALLSRLAADEKSARKASLPPQQMVSRRDRERDARLEMMGSRRYAPRTKAPGRPPLSSSAAWLRRPPPAMAVDTAATATVPPPRRMPPTVTQTAPAFVRAPAQQAEPHVGPVRTALPPRGTAPYKRPARTLATPRDDSSTYSRAIMSHIQKGEDDFAQDVAAEATAMNVVPPRGSRSWDDWTISSIDKEVARLGNVQNASAPFAFRASSLPSPATAQEPDQADRFLRTAGYNPLLNQ